jgi:flagellar basal-body rod modification protein FlgD
MTAVSGIWNPTAHVANPLSANSAKSAAATGGTTTTGSGNAATSSGASSTISANDFLTLLVTEMKNQDPTAQTDPNEYINQLVQVNSLEQLIDINQTLTTSLGSASGSPTSGAIAGRIGPSSAPVASALPAQVTNSTSGNGASPAAIASNPVFTSAAVPGDLTPPAPLPAAQRIAHALSGLK